jgi:hypothetical protein
MTSLLDDNLSALARVDAASVGWARGTADAGPIVVAGDGADVRLIAADGRALRLHSSRDPHREAESQVAQALGDREASVVAVIGAGAGFVLEVLEPRREIRLLVVEPTRDLALAWLARRSWRSLIESGRLRLLVGPDYTGSASASRLLGGAWSHLPIVVNPVLAREAPAELMRARTVLDRAAKEALQNDDARVRFEDVAFRQTIANVPLLLHGVDAATLDGVFEGQTAIVVGAGPSLDRNVETLRRLQSSCLVVAADTAVVPCLKGGVTPHLAVALDPSLDNARHLTRLRVPDSVHLVCEAGVDASVPKAFAGRTFFFRVGRHAPWPWLESAGIELGILEAWGSVVTSAIDLAVRAGCSPIVFAGLDLAFTRGQPYCRYTPLDDLWAWQVAAGHRLEDLWEAHRRWRPMVLEGAVEGGDTPTAAHLITFRDWIRDYATARPHVRFVNGTGAGILHGAGIDVATLDEVLAAAPVTGTADIAGIVARIRAGAGQPVEPSTVLARLMSAPPLDLLAGHAAPQAAAGRVDWQELWKRVASQDVAPAAASQPRPDGADRGSASIPPFWLPDAARALRALDAHHREDAADLGRRHETRARDCLQRALEVIRSVLMEPLEATRDGIFHDAGADPWADVPALAQVTWPPDVRPLVETATAAIHQALLASDWPIQLDDRRSAYFMAAADPRVEACVIGPAPGEERVPASHVGVDALVWQWTRVAAAALEADAAIGRIVSGLRALPPPRLPPAAARTGLSLWLAPEGVPEGTGGVTVVPFLHDRAVLRAATGLLTRDPAPPCRPSAEPAAPGAFRLFALPRHWRPDQDRLRTSEVPWSTIIEPDVLTDRGLSACRLATRLNERQALLTRFDGSGSYIVDQQGRINRSQGWSRRVDGEISCGPHGRLAWSWDGASHVLFRPAPGMDERAWELPVAPMQALDDGQASALLATTGGLWRWCAEGGPQLVAPGPSMVALHRQGTGVRAYPRPTILSSGTRQAVDQAFDWSDGAAACVPVAVTPGEACFSRSTVGDWTADTWMDASVVRISHRSGAVFWLACSGPRSAAWAGRSLLVTVLPQGDVLLFRNLIDAVQPHLER